MLSQSKLLITTVRCAYKLELFRLMVFMGFPNPLNSVLSMWCEENEHNNSYMPRKPKPPWPVNFLSEVTYLLDHRPQLSWNHNANFSMVGAMQWSTYSRDCIIYLTITFPLCLWQRCTTARKMRGKLSVYGTTCHWLVSEPRVHTPSPPFLLHKDYSFRKFLFPKPKGW